MPAMSSRLLHLSRCVSLPRREPPQRNRHNHGIRAIEPEKLSTSTSTSKSSSPPPRFPACDDAYDSTRALLLSLAVTSIGSAGGGVGFLANWRVGAFSDSLPLADARALAAFAVEGSQLAAVSLVASSFSKAKAGNGLTFDFFRDYKKTIAIGLVGGLAAVAAVAAADSFFSSFFFFPSSETAEATATSLAASVLSDASGPLPRAALLTASCVLAPATEELVFRGILLRRLLLGRSGSGGSVSGSWGSLPLVAPVATSAAAFAASHLFVLASDGGSRSETAKELLLLFVLGLVLGATAVASNGGIVEEGEEETGRQKESESSGGESKSESDGGSDGAKREESSGSFNLAVPALAHALYNAIAYCVASAASG